MRVLMIGGTKFIGRRITEELIARGDEVTVVHRGQTEPAYNMMVGQNLQNLAANSTAEFADIPENPSEPPHSSNPRTNERNRRGHADR